MQLPHDKRINKARQWLPTYKGEHLIRAYHKRFGVDRLRAIMDLGELDVYDEEKLTQLIQSERERLAAESKHGEIAKHNLMIAEIDSKA